MAARQKASGTVGDARPKIDLGPDQTLCQGSAAPVLDATTAGATYVWTVPTGVAASGTNNPKQAVDVSSPATLTAIQKYKVAVTITIDPATLATCTAKDSVSFTVKPMPTFTFTKADPTGGCGTQTGTTSIVLTGPENVLYSYFISGPQTASGIDLPVSPTPIVNPASAGIYFASVSNQVSLCSAVQSVTLSDLLVSIISSNPTTCTTALVTVTTTNISAPYQYTVADAAGVTVDSKTGVAGVSFNTKPLPPGTYTIQVTGSNGCVASSTSTVSLTNPPLDFIVVPDLCATPVTLTTSTAAAGATYTWTGPNIVQNNISNVLVSPPVGPAVYTTTGSAPGFCDNVVTTNITIPAAFTPSITQTGNCTDQVTLTASPAGSNYTYNWFLQDPTTSTFSLVGSGSQIFVNTPGASTYALDVSDGSGCPATRVIQVVNVYGELKVVVTATPACDNGKPFTLTSATNGISPTYAWSLNDTPIAGATNSTLQETSIGNYTVTVTASGCQKSSNVSVQSVLSPVGNLPSAAIICADPANPDHSTRFLVLDPGLFTSYNWFEDGVTIDSTQEKIIISKAGTYKVDITNDAGCTSTDQTIVENNCEPVLNAPNAFRPASGVDPNKAFQVFSFFIDDDKFQIFIYNRWGELIYTSSDRNFRWYGTMSATGEPTPGGTYAYVIRYVSSYRPEQGIQEKHGGVILLR